MAAALATPAFAWDSYRYLHVSIQTPWTIFLFLLVAVLSPFILMVVLVWRFAGRKDEGDATGGGNSSEYPEK